MVSLRQMIPADIETVVQLDMHAFSAYRRQMRNNSPVLARTRRNVLANLKMNPPGCFVAEADKLVGYIFTHIWGTTGWIGTFGVHPNFQGLGIGKSLLTTAVEYLQEASCVTIGLETMFEGSYNVGLYSSFGFQPTIPTVHLVKKTAPVAMASPYTMHAQIESEEASDAISKISHAACPGLDYAAVVSNARAYEWGETLLIGWPQPWAFSVVRIIPKREGTFEPVADIEAIVIHPEAKTRLKKAFQTVESFVMDKGLKQMKLALNAADADALQQTLVYGFRVCDVMLRMVVKGENTPPAGRILSKWMM